MNSHSTPQAADNSDRLALRTVEAVIGFHGFAEGSVLYSSGKTRVLCSVSIDHKVPDWMRDKGEGWLTAEYQMHPRANPQRRERRDGRGRNLSGRSTEIQRLIGRSLRAAIDFKALGERTIVVDCDVLEADGGTRTAAITGGFIALAQALAKLQASGVLTQGVLIDQVAAVSVGFVGEQLVSDLCYAEDSTAEVDFNLVGTATADIVEVQGTAEGRAMSRTTLDQLIHLGSQGVTELCRKQSQFLADAGINLQSLFVETLP